MNRFTKQSEGGLSVQERRREILARLSDSEEACEFCDNVARAVTDTRGSNDPEKLSHCLRTMKAYGRADLAQRTAMDTATGPGVGMVSTEAANLIIDLTETYSISQQTLNFQRALTGKRRFGKITGISASVVLKPASAATQVSAGTITGPSADGDLRSVVGIIEASPSVLEDGAVDLSKAIPTIIAKANAAAIDTFCFVGDGADDTVSADMTGIFNHGDTVAVTATTAQSAADLDEEDFRRTVAAVAAGALERGCRWWMHPTIYKAALQISATGGSKMIQFYNGVPYIFGWPVSLTAVAPSTDAAASKMVLFGCGEAYLLSQLSDILIAQGSGQKFNYNLAQIRVVTRARGDMLDGTWFAVLSTHS